MAVLQLCLLALFVVGTKSTYMFSNTIVVHNGNYNVSYHYNESADTLEFLVEVRTTGWVGFGFALIAPNSMQNYDVAVGGVLSNGSGYLKDYFTKGFRQPPLDSQQDWMLTNANELNGTTTLRFYRKRNTTDENDTAIEQGKSIFLIWAYHNLSDVEAGQFTKHTFRGALPVTLIPAASMTVPTVTATASVINAIMSTSTAVGIMETMESSMAAMTTSTLAAMTTSTMAPMTTSTPAVEPTPTPSPVSSSAVVTPAPARPVHFPNFDSFDNGKYNASWVFNSSTDTLHFMVEVRTTGWIGFGVATQAPTSMVGYDVAVGGVFNGSGYIEDYLTIGRTQPRMDSQRDWMLTYSREESGVTTLRFYRKRNTTDQNDTAIEQGMPIFLIWAYHNMSDVQPGQFPRHSYRGFAQVTLIPAATPTPATTLATTPAPVRPVHFGNFLSFNNGNYNASWMYNSSGDTLHFMVEVRATGWIGFGVANQAPTGMQGYDVAVGGVLSGSGYLKDYLTNGQNQPPVDSQQDWMLSYSREENGVTTLRFYRKRDTNDQQNDVVIQEGMSVFLIWAYHPTDDVTPSQFTNHGMNYRGFQQVTLIPAAPTLSPTPSPTPTPVRPVHFGNFLSFNNGNYNASWMYNNSADTLHFMVEVRATGWIGFGVATQAPTNMSGYDVGVGGVFNGSGYIEDYLTIGRTQPRMDSQRDWMLSYSREENGVTTLRFYRKRNTTDQNDTAIEQGMPIFVLWAYHNMSDVQPGQFPRHSYRGFAQVTLIPAATPTPATTLATTPAPVRPVHFSNFLPLNNGNYNTSWMYNSSADTLHFMVEVRATGWIGFGVAKQAPNNMNGYDVAVGGVLSGSGYLRDYLTNGQRQPPVDSQEDWMLSYSREESGVTTLRFYRKRDTNDQQNDVVIQQGMSIFLIWAYHPTNDVTPSQFSYHGGNYRGVQQVTLIPAAPTPTPTTNFTQAFDNNQFLVLREFRDQTDKMYYHVRVKTTGWVGFGFAETAPNNMMNYDVIVGGFSNGKGYLHDYFTQGRRQPLPDASQDYTLLGASEFDGYTELMFERKRDTGDNNDLAFQPGEGVYIIWAYDDDDITDNSTFDIHSAKGISLEKVIMVPGQQPVPTEPAAASSLHSSIHAIITLTIVLINVLLMYN